ncbi:MAG: amylo-alpha-1,6-glucosidase [Sphingobacteriales bacterium]|nr:MAG: amylo-alpha-1,6-glucosidase [Sphingobacteriales bacterium]
MNDIIQLENKYYISVNSSYADDRVKVLNHTNTFGIFDRWGDIKLLGEEVQGIYHNGTRYISDIELLINDKRPLLLSSSVKRENEILSIDLTNPAFKDVEGDQIANGLIHIGRSKFLRDGECHEEIRLNNFGNETCTVEISLFFNADFKDIFEVRGIGRSRRGDIYQVEHAEDSTLRICYRGLDKIKRITEVRFSQKPFSWEKLNKAVFRIELQPRVQTNFDYTLHFLTEDNQPDHSGYAEGRERLETEVKKGYEIISGIRTSNEQFNQWLNRSQYDLLSLLADTRYGKYPFAGVPWYNTAFGRDGIITSLQVLWIAPDIAKDVLNYLAQTQATEENPYQDAEPGKVIHEVRSGEMVELGEIPFKRYYGSVDATPLFVVLAGAYYKRTGDLETIERIWPNIEAALNWIDKYGDIDGDGFVDYKHKSENGLTNQGWKDSYDSISDENGDLAVPPIALCEVQGYVYDAKVHAAILSEKLGYIEKAQQLREEAEDLKKRFNEQYWDEEQQCFVIALDGNKKACRVVSSNAGHCLYSGIVDEEKAGKLIARLMQDDMFNGWGIRTLSKNEQRFNPMSYHNGSIWPHDVSLIARGFSTYGFKEETSKLTTALFDASIFIELQRLPELFCGFDRRRDEGPTDYPVACSPQSWAVASVFMLLEACLNIKIDVAEQRVYFNKPFLPQGLDFIEISRLKLGDGYADLELHCENEAVGIKVKNCPQGWQILLITES